MRAFAKFVIEGCAFPAGVVHGAVKKRVPECEHDYFQDYVASPLQVLCRHRPCEL